MTEYIPISDLEELEQDLLNLINGAIQDGIPPIVLMSVLLGAFCELQEQTQIADVTIN